MSNSDILSYVSLLKSKLKATNSTMINLMLSGSHLFGWDSHDSDLDFRGFHVINTVELFKLVKPRDTFELMHEEIDYVSFEIEKTIKLVLKNNGNVLEQIFAKQLYYNDDFVKLRELAVNSFSKRLYNHYKGLADNNYGRFIDTVRDNYKVRTVKKYLYIFRALMIGIHVLKNNQLIPNILELNKKMKIPYVNKLVELKVNGNEWSKLTGTQESRIRLTIKHLYERLDEAYADSSLPEKPEKDLFEDYLINIRQKYLKH